MINNRPRQTGVSFASLLFATLVMLLPAHAESDGGLDPRVPDVTIQGQTSLGPDLDGLEFVPVPFAPGELPTSLIPGQGPSTLLPGQGAWPPYAGQSPIPVYPGQGPAVGQLPPSGQWPFPTQAPPFPFPPDGTPFPSPQPPQVGVNPVPQLPFPPGGEKPPFLPPPPQFPPRFTPPPPPVRLPIELASHGVVCGDTLGEILTKKVLAPLRRAGINPPPLWGPGGLVNEVARANGIPNPNLIFPGQIIVIPVPGRATAD